MQQVYMTRPGVENGAWFPESAVPHWESYGWAKSDPPEKPTRPARTQDRPRPRAPRSTNTTGAAGEPSTPEPVADAKSAVPARPKPKSAPKGEED